MLIKEFEKCKIIRRKRVFVPFVVLASKADHSSNEEQVGALRDERSYFPEQFRFTHGVLRMHEVLWCGMHAQRVTR